MVWECLAFKRIGDDVSGNFASNAGMTRFNGIAGFADDMTSYADQSAFDANWIPEDSTAIRGNPSTDVIDIIDLSDGSFDGIFFDLWSHGIFPSDTNWTLRFKYDITSISQLEDVGLSFDLGLSDNRLARSAVQDSIMLETTIDTDGGQQQFRIQAPNNVAVSGGTIVATFSRIPTVETLYVEMKRTSATRMECTFFSDASWSIPLEKVKGTISSGIVNLRYIVAKKGVQSATTNNIVGTIDDVQFFNNTEGVGGFLPNQELVLHGDEIGTSTEFNPGSATKIITGADDGNWSVGGGPSVTGGVVSGWGADSTWKRATYDLLGNDAITLDNSNWTIDFEFERTDNDDNPSHSPFMLVDTAAVAYNIDPTNNAAPFPQNGVAVHYGLNGVNGHKFSLFYRKEVSGDFGSGSTIVSPDSQSILIAQNVTFYVRLMRINGTKYVLEVYNDSARTSLHGSIVINAPDDTLSTLTWINSSSNTTGGSGRILNGTVANITIFNGVSGEFVGGLALSDDFSSYGTPVGADFVDTFDSAVGWITSDSTRVRVEDEQGFAFAFAPASSLSVESMVYDLITNEGITPGNSWLLRFKYSLTNVFTGPVDNTPAYILVGISDSNQGTGSSSPQDWIGFESVITKNLGTPVNGIGVFILDAEVNGNPRSGPFEYVFSNAVVPTERAIWVEVIRVSDTLAKCSIYGDENFSDLLETSGIVTIPAASNLRYLKIMEENTDGSADSTHTATIDDVMFWNNRTSSCDSPTITPNFFDDFSTYASQPAADLAWVPQITFPSTGYVQVDIGADNLRWQMIRNGADNRCTHDLGTPLSDTEWTLRCRFHLNAGNVLATAVGANIQLLLQDTDVGQSSINDSLSYGMQNTALPFGRQMAIVAINNGANVGFDNEPNDAVAYSGVDVDYYLEFSRLSATSFRARRFANSDYTGLIQELFDTFPAGITGLRYLICSSGDQVTAWNGSEFGYFDDIEIFDGVQSAFPWIADTIDSLFLDPCAENIVYTSLTAGPSDGTIYFDLVTPLSDSKFVFRFTWYIQEVAQGALAPNQNTFIQMQSQPVGTLGVKDSIGIAFRLDQNDDTFEVWAEDDPGPTILLDTFIVPTNQTKFYIEVIRESSTLQRVSFFSDPNYTFLISTFTQTIPATITGLQYFVINRNIGGANDHISSGHIDDVKVWDGTDVADSIGAKRYLQVLAHSVPGVTGSQDLANLRFNIDDDNNYNYVSSFNGSVDGPPSLNQNQVRIQSGSTLIDTDRFYDASIINPLVNDKLYQSHENDQRTLFASSIPDRSENAGKWANIITRISRISLVDQPSLSGIWGTDTEVVVFGADHD